MRAVFVAAAVHTSTPAGNSNRLHCFVLIAEAALVVLGASVRVDSRTIGLTARYVFTFAMV